MTAAGIDPANFGYVEFIVAKESGWNPSAVNPTSGACGLGQQLPCGKWAGAWNDPVAALVAMDSYVSSRYGGWAGAHGFWLSHNYY
ncbi:aggregation-promoting factor C-terminal-like domain-containing protein [Arthrobacter burdickii]